MASRLILNPLLKRGGMFSKNNHASNEGTPLSIIGSDLHIIGNVETSGDLQIEGRIEGDIQAKSLVIGDNAHIHGSVICHDIQVRGCVEGAIRAHNVILTKRAKVIGDIQHETLSIEVGAFVDGRCQHINLSDAEEEVSLLESTKHISDETGS